MNADVLTKTNFQSLLDFHASNAAAATMGVREYNFELPYGVITADHHRLIEIREKPTQSFMVNAGIYVLEPNILDLVSPDTFLDMTELFKKIIEHRYEAAVFPIHEYWIDIGLMNDLQKVKEDYQENLK
jgi:NDP-sugar pyrophosphorylase family protein